MTTLFLSAILVLCSFNPFDRETAVDLSGEWRITGSTQYGNLDFDWLIVDFDDQIEITKKSGYGNNDVKQNVIEYAKSSSRVLIKIYEDVGVGPTTHIFSLRIIDNNTLKGSLEMKSGSVGGLPGMTITSSVTMQRR